ncbi:hypothetical protein PRIPAC_91231 [Pristionchus pacificus]|uniref:Uncharacterized protein n=1 Tax=Pristionchus pacificus TaxID=54126 RepID=A0A454XSX5_PRIPA|nr:hypothetical protein PRIPAC_91231 [Pristionchus pacificus]|eukprot:PDM61514.1 hypothetical protein PRIPAC_50956 [Pristionchus pacificus]
MSFSLRYSQTALALLATLFLSLGIMLSLNATGEGLFGRHKALEVVTFAFAIVTMVGVGVFTGVFLSEMLFWVLRTNIETIDELFQYLEQLDMQRAARPRSRRASAV